MHKLKNLSRKQWILIAVLVLAGAAAGVFFAHTTTYGVYAAVKILVVILALFVVSLFVLFGRNGMRDRIRRHKRGLTGIILIEAAMLFYMYFFVYYLKTIQNLYNQVQILIGVLIMILTFFVFLLLESNKVPLHSVYICIGIGMGLIFLFIQPTGYVPDERAHLYAAYDVSNTMMGISRMPDGSMVMRQDDTKPDLEAIRTIKEDMAKYEVAYWESLDDPPESEEIVSIYREPIQTQRYQYFFPALGLTIARSLHLGTTAAFFWGRLFNMLWFVFLTAYAIRVIPFGKTVLMLLAIMPMTLQQASSFSYDVFVNSTSFLIVALTMNLAFAEETGSRRRIIRYGILLAACVLLLPVKGYVYAPLCALPLLLVFLRWKKNRKEALFAILILAVCAFTFAGSRILPMIRQTGVFSSQASVAYNGQTQYTLSTLLNDKKEGFYVLLNTSRVFKEYYLESMIGTPLGWLSIELNPVLIYAYAVLLVLASLQKKDERSYMGTGTRVFLQIMAWGSVGAVLLGMLLAYSPIAYHRIEGVQGRYFIPLVLPMLLTVRSDRILAARETDKGIVLAAMVLLFWAFHMILT